MAPDSHDLLPMLTAEAILGAADTPEEVLPVPEWGGSVRIRGLTKRQQVDARARSMVNGEVDVAESQMVLWMEGVIEPRFTREQMAALFEKNAGAVDRVLKRLLVLSGMDDGAVKEKERQFRPST